MAKKTTQISKLVKRLSTGVNLTKAEAKRIGINTDRLSRMVYDLRQEGHTIYTNTVNTRNGKVTAYRLAD